MAAQDDRAHVTISDVGLRIIDAANPRDPIEIDRSCGLGYCSGVAVAESLALVVTLDGALRVPDVGEPKSPRLVASLPEAKTLRAISIRGEHAYVTADGEGLRVFATADPLRPREVGVIRDMPLACGLTLVEDHALVATNTGDRHHPDGSPAAHQRGEPPWRTAPANPPAPRRSSSPTSKARPPAESETRAVRTGAR